MSASVILIVLAVLVFTTTLNLFLILRIARVVFPPDEAEPVVPLVGQPAPRFEASRQADGRSIASDDLKGHPLVLVFLSAGCSTCRTKTAELLEILPATQQAGVALWIVAADDVHDLAALTADSALADRTLAMEPTARKALNPLSAAPLYIFIDEAMIVRAGNYLGDDDWRTFVSDMRG